MELSTVQNSRFSKWVLTEPSLGEHKVFVPSIKYSEEKLKELLHRWCKKPGNPPPKKLKLFIRQGIEPKMRSLLWNDVCVGSESLTNSPNFFHDVQEEIGKLLLAKRFQVQRNLMNYTKN